VAVSQRGGPLKFRFLTLRGTLIKLVEAVREVGEEKAWTDRLSERQYQPRLGWSRGHYEIASQANGKHDIFTRSMTPILRAC